MGRISEAEAAFRDVYDKDVWALASGEYSAMREGEEPEAQRIARLSTLVTEFIRLNQIRSVVEFGCGFWSYARQIDWSGVEYDGFDVMDDIVAYNSGYYGSDNIRFHRVTNGTTLPCADLLISKDVLQHLPTEHIHYYLDVFRRNFKFMLIANDVVPDDNLNGDTHAGGYRALRLDLPPFDEPCAVLQTWVTRDFGIHTVKNFCLMFGRPDPACTGVVLRDAERRVVPLARFAGAVMRRLRG